MSNLTSPRNTVTVGPQLFGEAQPLAAGAKVVEGCLVAVNSSGQAIDLSNTDGYHIVGIATRSVDNTTGAAAALSCVAVTGRFLLNGSSVTQADVGKKVYALDNHTVTTTSTNHLEVGVCVGLDADSGQIEVEVRIV